MAAAARAARAEQSNAAGRPSCCKAHAQIHTHCLTPLSWLFIWWTNGASSWLLPPFAPYTRSSPLLIASPRCALSDPARSRLRPLECHKLRRGWRERRTVAEAGVPSVGQHCRLISASHGRSHHTSTSLLADNVGSKGDGGKGSLEELNSTTATSRPPRLLIVYHIPKTGGSSLVHWLKSLLAAKERGGPLHRACRCWRPAL